MEPEPSPLHEALARIGDRWTLLIVAALLDGPRRFGELSDEVGGLVPNGIAPNVLTKRLRQLEADGIVVSSPYSRRPLRVAYELTGPGRELAGALALLTTWGQRHTDGEDTGHHAACGTTLEAKPWCPTCDRVVDEPEVSQEISL